MKNSTIFWSTMALFIVYKVLSWRIGLGGGFLHLGPNGQLNSFDILVVVCVMIYLVICLLEWMVEDAEDHSHWNIIFWFRILLVTLVNLLEKFNELMDNKDVPNT